jgi:lysophospholipase L1-like esterase
VNPRKLLSALLFLGLTPALATAQTTTKKYLAFGDSITAGVGDDATRPKPGYPPRLESLLQTVGVTTSVLPFGVGGEKTPEGIARIDSVLAQGVAGDVLLLMEGTNDISKDISLETTIFNLDEMSHRAELLGLGAIQATVIPREPDAKVDPDNVLTDQLNGRVRNLAGVRGRRLADPNSVFSGTPNLFGGFYNKDPDDHVGHPNAAGYDILARVWFNVIQGIDTVAPVPGVLTPLRGARNVKPDVSIEVDVWDFGAGIDLANTFLLVNNQVVQVVPTGTTKQAHLSYKPPSPFSGTIAVGLRSRDLATPPNAIDREISRFTVQGANFIQGDVNEDGRVDGMDLVRFALHFGTQRGDARWDIAADFNNDGRVDGVDLAVLASNFGRSGGTGGGG